MHVQRYDIPLSNGAVLYVVTDLMGKHAPAELMAAVDSWAARTWEFTSESFAAYLKSKRPELFIKSLEDYKRDKIARKAINKR